jgi:hypothetical protein
MILASLTHLRRGLPESWHMRICVDGRMRGMPARYSSIIEEALLAWEADKPLYRAGCLGSATAALIDVVRGARNSMSCFLRCRGSLQIRLQPSRGARAGYEIDARGVARPFALGRARIGERLNRLSAAENQRLLNTTAVDDAIDLRLTAMARASRELRPARGELAREARTP